MTLSTGRPISSADPRKAIVGTLGRDAEELLGLVYDDFGSAPESGRSGGRDDGQAEAATYRLQAEQRNLERQAHEKLKRLSPRVLLQIEQVLAAVDHRRGLDYLRYCGVDRFLWWVGATATGSSSDPNAVADLGAVAARWLANRHLLGSLQRMPADVALAISLNPNFEDTRRIAQSEIRFSWVTRLICEEMAQAVSGNADHAELLPEVTVSAVQGVMAVLSRCVGAGYAEYSAGLSGSPQTKKLARSLSVPAGSFGARADLLPLLFAREVETHPFVDLDSEVVPAALRTASQGLEVALLELVRRRIPELNVRGAVYEAAVIGCLKKVAPPGLNFLDLPAHVRVSKTDEGEVDFACQFDNRYLLLGEAKSYVVSQASHSVIGAFEDDMRKALTQLQVRRQAFAGGSPLKAAGTTVKIGDVRSTYGIAVPLHSYATAVWNLESLSVLDVDLTNVSIIPLHQLIILLQTMSTPRVLATYLAWRAARVSRGIVIYDETDLLVQFLADEATVPAERVDIHAIPVSRVIQRFYDVDHDVLVTEPMPTDRSAWLRRLWRVTHAPEDRRAAQLFCRLS